MTYITYEEEYSVMHLSRVADLHHLNADPASFHFDADPDPNFHSDVDPDPAPHQCDANLQLPRPNSQSIHGSI
jgi:hypothetical protein